MRGASHIILFVVIVLLLLCCYNSIASPMQWMQQMELQPSETFFQLQKLYQQHSNFELEGITPIQNIQGTIQVRCAMMRSSSQELDSQNEHQKHAHHAFLYIWKADDSTEHNIVWNYQNESAIHELSSTASRMVIRQGFLFSKSNTLLLHSEYMAVSSSSTTATPQLTTTKISKKQGPQSILFLRVDFSDRKGHPISTSAVEAHLLRAQQFFKQSSFGKMTIQSWQIPPVFHLSKPVSYYRQFYYQMVEEANSIFSSMYALPINSFDFVVCSFGSITELSWGALATVNGNQIWYNLNTISDFALFHEYGHNMGVNSHSGAFVSLETPPVAFGGLSSIIEYGDIFDVMGASYVYPSDYNVAVKQSLGWLSSTTILTLTAPFSGQVTLHAMDSEYTTAQNQLTMISIPWNTKQKMDYFVQFRQRHPNPRFLTGAVDLHMKYANMYQNSTHLIDSTPTSTFGFDDAPITLGQTFTDDSVSPNIFISVISKSDCSTFCSIDLYLHYGFSDNTTQWQISLQIPYLSFLDLSKYQLKRAMPLIAQVTNNQPQSIHVMYFDLDQNEYASQSPFVMVPYKTFTKRQVQFTISNGKGAQQTISKQIEFVQTSQFSSISCQFDYSKRQAQASVNTNAAHLLLIHNDITVGYATQVKQITVSDLPFFSSGVHEIQTIAVDQKNVIDASDKQFVYVDHWKPSATFVLTSQKQTYQLIASVMPMPVNYAIYKTILFAPSLIKEDSFSVSHNLESFSSLQLIGDGQVTMLYPYSIQSETIVELDLVNSILSTSTSKLYLCFQSILQEFNVEEECVSIFDMFSVQFVNSKLNLRFHLGKFFLQNKSGTKNILYFRIIAKNTESITISNVKFLEPISIIQQQTLNTFDVPNYGDMDLQYKWRYSYTNQTSGEWITFAVQSSENAKSVVFPTLSPFDEPSTMLKVELQVYRGGNQIAKQNWSLQYNNAVTIIPKNVESNLVFVAAGSTLSVFSVLFFFLFMVLCS